MGRFFTFLATVSLGLSSVFAQNSETLSLDEVNTEVTSEAKTAVPKKSKKNVERLEVTGSYIRRTDVEGPSPISIIDQEQFELTGTTSVEDVLRESSLFSGFNGDGSVYFRGQHSANMLVLINGLRLPKAGNFYNSIRELPSNVIERVEILKDGSSATYGSDALSGVINFITKKDTDGAYVSTSFLAPERGIGQEQNYLATFGQSYSRGNIMGVVQYRKTEDYFEADLGSENFDNSANYPGLTSFGSLTSKNESFNTQDFGGPCSQGVCETDSNLLEQVRPSVTELGALLTGKFEAGSDWDFSALTLYSRNERRFNFGDPRSLQLRNIPVSQLSASTKANLASSLGPEDTVSLNYTPLAELGPVVGQSTNDNVIAQAQGTHYINDSWNLKFEGGYGLTNSASTYTGGEANTEVLEQMFVDGSFVPGANSDLSASQLKPTLRYSGQSTNIRAITSGELFQLGATPLSMAVGVEGQWEDVKEDHDAIASAGVGLNTNVPPNGSTGRGVQSSFVEFAANPISSLEVQLAGRFDSYSDVGDTFNPKVALAYKPINQLLFRTSLGTGFRAPGVWDLIERQSQRTSRDFDGDVTIFNDQNINPERGITYNFGTIIEPIKGLSFTIDQWNYEGRDVITSPSDSEFLENPERFGSATIVKDANNEPAALVRPRLVNIGRRVFRGIDFGTNYSVKLKSNTRLGVSTSHTYTYRLNEIRGASSPENRYKGRWKNTTSTFANFGSHLTRLAMRTVSRIEDPRLDRTGALPRHTEFDLTYAYTAPWQGRFGFTVKNIFDDQPPVRSNDNGRNFGDLRFDFTSFSPLRRRFFFSYSQPF